MPQIVITQGKRMSRATVCGAWQNAPMAQAASATSLWSRRTQQVRSPEHSNAPIAGVASISKSRPDDNCGL